MSFLSPSAIAVVPFHSLSMLEYIVFYIEYDC